MNYAAVVRNFFTKGPIETIKLRQKRQKVRRLTDELENNRIRLEERYRRSGDRSDFVRYADALSKECLHIASSYSALGECAYGMLRERLEERFSLMPVPCLLESDEDCGDSVYLAALAEVEPSRFKNDLKRDYLLNRLPQAYASELKAPVRERTALFLQPRTGLNQAFKYMYNYLKEHGYGVELVELGRGEVPVSLYYRNAEKFVRKAATAKVIFVHESNELLGHVPIRSDSKVVQLWHGCGVFKKIGLDTAGLPGYKSREAYEEFPEYNYFSCVTIASPELSWVFEQFMGISHESGIIQPLGVSRTDCFFDEDFIEKSYAKLHEKIPQAEGKKVILYAPTYRGLGAKRVAPKELDIEKMAKELSDRYVLIVKHHQTAKELPEIPESAKDSFAFDMTRGKGMDIAELMTVADVCISDYSSLVFEYSLFERPMAFFVYDLEEYIDDRGLYYNFDEITPGPLCKTTDELISYLDNIEVEFDKNEVAAFKNRFMSSCDGHSTERIVRFIEEG